MNSRMTEFNEGLRIPPPSPLMGEEKKELILLAAYLNVGIVSEAKARMKLAEFNVILKSLQEDIEENTNYKIYFVVMPVRDQDTKIECLFPRNLDDIDSEILTKITEETLLL